MANKNTKTARQAGQVVGDRVPHTFERLREALAKLPKEWKL